MFWSYHTPSSWGGTQYRSAVFVHTPEQRAWVELSLKSRGVSEKIVPVEDAGDFYRAEEYHQKYVEKKM